jgi:hypothetical protein
MMISLNKEQWIVCQQLIGWLKADRNNCRPGGSTSKFENLTTFINTLEKLIPTESPSK